MANEQADGAAGAPELCARCGNGASQLNAELNRTTVYKHGDREYASPDADSQSCSFAHAAPSATSPRIVIESPLAGEFVRNFRFLLWCCRAVWEREGLHALASHLLNPWYMDDTVPAEREAGIANPWAWSPDVPHVAFVDLGVSSGMARARARCLREGIPHTDMFLREYAPLCWEAFGVGGCPTHTPGFVLGPHSSEVAGG